MGFGKFPGIAVRLGHWFVAPIPDCGCDACDETFEECVNQLSELTGTLTSGGLSEGIELRPVGPAWYQRRMPSSGGKTRLERVDARARIVETGGRTRFDYAPWPRRVA